MEQHPEFPLEEGLCYLNHAAVAPWPLRTAEAVRRFTEENLHLGSKHYPQWMAVEGLLREQLQRLINAPTADDIALLKNTSEGLSLIAYGLDWLQGENIVIAEQEFPSNRIVWESLASQGVETRMVDISGDDPEQALIDQMNDQTRLLSVSTVQYGSGLRMDLARLANACRERGVLLCIDAIQGLGALQFDLQQVDADFVVADGHKWMLGPEGLALFYCRAELRDQLRLNQYGWHMVEAVGDFDQQGWQVANTARRFECGSPNMVCIHALSASLSLLEETGYATVESEVLKRSRYLFERIKDEPKLELLTSAAEGRYAGIVTFSHINIESKRLYEQLMSEGVMCAARGGGVRFSPHFYTPYEVIDSALALAVTADL
ncbi:class V aminotransferase [Solemya pervernicosa gill symbiont]|uniref:Class V aminotransferase n=2 Tax=Gammaproteobacteria incertae sedis TaxID=118884 RepID=A0A1T2L1S4_9GAMM|nr:aminotransferase class V-fold PLP-dependent enzyme [Solemya pervernicosa gill symbiont]OOZ39021.1 class V aminotransferase [Solemya pervernicosa gill symbiont]